MQVTQAIKQRHSTRAFLDKPVEKSTIETILDTAKHAPSGVNMQPWEVLVVTGQSKASLSNKMVDAYKRGQTEKMDYHYYPKTWIDPFKTRRFETGMKLYQALDISREEKEKRMEQWLANYRAFDAPVMLLFLIDNSLETGSYMDYGMFLQNIMLMAEEMGLATCPQGAIAEFPTLIKQHFNIDENKKLIGGMALGFEDTEHPVNQYRTERSSLEAFCSFYD